MHDTSGIAAASVLAAIDKGCDTVDGARWCVERGVATGDCRGWQCAARGSAHARGAIVNVAVEVGQTARAGITRLSLETVKMESHITVDSDSVLERVLVKPGDRVQAKDLLIVLKKYLLQLEFLLFVDDCCA